MTNIYDENPSDFVITQHLAKAYLKCCVERILVVEHLDYDQVKIMVDKGT